HCNILAKKLNTTTIDHLEEGMHTLHSRRAQSHARRRRPARMVRPLTKPAAIFALMLAGALGNPGVHAQGYPSRTVRLIIPFPPSGPADIVGRLVAEHLAPVLGQPMVVENRGGVEGTIGTEAIARATPDGYTIGLATVSTHAVN